MCLWCVCDCSWEQRFHTYSATTGRSVSRIVKSTDSEESPCLGYHPECRGNRILRNVGNYVSHYTMSRPRRHTHTQCVFITEINRLMLPSEISAVNSATHMKHKHALCWKILNVKADGTYKVGATLACGLPELLYFSVRST
jgi:hypothetical protein